MARTRRRTRPSAGAPPARRCAGVLGVNTVHRNRRRRARRRQCQLFSAPGQTIRYQLARNPTRAQGGCIMIWIWLGFITLILLLLALDLGVFNRKAHVV